MAKHHVTATVNGDPVEFLCETQETLLDVAARPAGSHRHQGRLRHRRLRRLQRDRRRPAGVLLPDARRRRPRARRSPPSRAWPRATSCIRCSASSSSTPRSSAASARRASWSPPRRCWSSNPDPTETEVRYWLAGNLCRCTGYDKIVRAVLDAAAEMRGA